MTGDSLPAERLPGDGGVPETPETPEQRASHADRDKTVEILRVAAGDGRLTPAELDERLEAALSARTGSELATLTADLQGAQPQVKDLVRIDQRFSDTSRTGHWVVPRRMEIRTRGADVKLDFTQAIITHDTLHLDLDLGPGSDLTLIIKPGVVVDADDVKATLGDIKTGPGAHPDMPVTLAWSWPRIRGGDIVARFPRRTFPQWLRRQPGPTA